MLPEAVNVEHSVVGMGEDGVVAVVAMQVPGPCELAEDGDLSAAEAGGELDGCKGGVGVEAGKDGFSSHTLAFHNDSVSS